MSNVKSDQESMMKTRKLGTLEVSELGYGATSFASSYGSSPDRLDEHGSRRTYPEP